MQFTVKTENKNYLAKIVSLSDPRPHPNANRLQIFTIEGNNVITGLDAKKEDVYVYFPLESTINKEYLSYSNSFSDPELNQDKTKKGFFHKHGRIRAVKLRQIASEGYIVPFTNITNWLITKGKKIDLDDVKIGVEFSHFDDILICEKYVVISKQSGPGKNSHGAVKQQSRLVENQFRLHIDTDNLKKNIQNINPEDYISIGYKIHGTSAVVGRVLCKKVLNFFTRLLKKIKIDINENYYDTIWSSRKVIKNSRYIDKSSKSYYDVDIWGLAAKKLEPFIKDGITLYFEIAGYLPSNTMIQKDFDYGVDKGHFDTWIYRITYTSLSGEVFEFSHHQIVKYCEKYGLKTVPYLYYGKAKDHFPELIVDENWHENFLEKLKEKYCEKCCFMCKSDVPEEGIILRKDQSDVFEVFKLKSFRFLERESIELDKETVDIESEQSIV